LLKICAGSTFLHKVQMMTVQLFHEITGITVNILLSEDN